MKFIVYQCQRKGFANRVRYHFKYYVIDDGSITAPGDITGRHRGLLISEVENG